MSHIRFKTEQEMIAEFGGLHKVPGAWNISDMKGAAGEPYSGSIGTDKKIPNCSSVWNISKEMLTDKQLLPINTEIAIPITAKGKPLSRDHKESTFLYYVGINLDKTSHLLSKSKASGSGYQYSAEEILAAYEAYNIKEDYNGKGFRAIIGGKKCTGRILISGKTIDSATYLCQDTIEGNSQHPRGFDYKYSWGISGGLQTLIRAKRYNSVEEFELIEDPQPPQISKSMGTKFQPGDEVYFTNSDGWVRQDGLHPDIKYTIHREKSPDSEWYKIQEGKEGYNHPDKNIRLWSEHPSRNLKITFKSGDKVYLEKKGSGVYQDGEKESSGMDDGLPLNTKLTVDYICPDGKYKGCIKLNEYSCFHTPEKFKPWSEHPSQKNPLTPNESFPLKKFNKGNIISFVGLKKDEYDESRFTIKNYHTEGVGIPGQLIIHGSTYVEHNKGTVEDLFNEYYIVSYLATNGRKVQLGFKEKDLEFYSKQEQPIIDQLTLKQPIKNHVNNNSNQEISSKQEIKCLFNEEESSIEICSPKSRGGKVTDLSGDEKTILTGTRRRGAILG